MRQVSDCPTPRDIDGIDRLVCLYLILPTLLFCLWFVAPVAIVLAALSIYGTCRALRGRESRLPTGVSRPIVLTIIVVSLAWTALAGVGHFFFANSDWLVRDAVLHDLSLFSWPPTYIATDSSLQILRAAIGYFLPASVIGHQFGTGAANIALYAWTALGWGLVLTAACSLFKTRGQQIACLIVLTCFGGMDLLGYMWGHRQLPPIGDHIEWWMRNIQYSSNSTLLFWVPNHALPAWLATTLVLRHWRQPQLALITPLLSAAIPLWSPLAAIGMFPFFLFGLAWRKDIKTIFSPHTCLPFVPIAIVSARYLGMDAGAVPHGWLPAYTSSPGEFAYDYILFCLLEFGILALLLARLTAYDLPMRVAIAVLCLLPFYYYGPANDLAMRASIPALLVLALATIRPLTQKQRSTWRILLVFVLAIGALGASEEPLRALIQRAWKPTQQTVPQAMAMATPGIAASFPPHYFAHANPTGVYQWMRKPAPVESPPQNRTFESRH